MADFAYNGVTLPYAQITNFNQEALYDEEGQTDHYLNKFDISVQSIVHANYLSLLCPQLLVGGLPGNALPANSPPATTNPADIMTVLRTFLLQPRKTLSLTFNGRQLIPQTQVATSTGSAIAGTVDAKNGPLPQSCNIIELTNTSFLLTFRIVAHYWERTLSSTSNGVTITNRQGNNVLYNRWQESVEFDNCMASTRTREGRMVIRSDNVDGLLADEIRTQMAVVSIPSGFLRTGSRYTVTPDGLCLQYSVTDKEVFKKPPAPAFEADGYYQENTTRGAAMRYAEAWVRLKGCKDSTISSQDALLVAAVAIAQKKASGSNSNYKANILEEANVKMNMYENEVECRFRYMLKAKPDRFRGIAAFAGMTTNTPNPDPTEEVDGVYPSDNGTTPPYRDRGTANILLRAAAYWDPSIPTQVLGPAPGFPSQGTTKWDKVTLGATKVQFPGALEPGKAGLNLETSARVG